jgi:hypothetical protein
MRQEGNKKERKGWRRIEGREILLFPIPDQETMIS